MNEKAPERYPARWTLRWQCPRCRRTWLAAAGIVDPGRRLARETLSSLEHLHCGTCGAGWAVWEVGIDWQPENEPARQQVEGRDALGHL